MIVPPSCPQRMSYYDSFPPFHSILSHLIYSLAGSTWDAQVFIYLFILAVVATAPWLIVCQCSESRDDRWVGGWHSALLRVLKCRYNTRVDYPNNTNGIFITAASAAGGIPIIVYSQAGRSRRDGNREVGSLETTREEMKPSSDTFVISSEKSTGDKDRKPPSTIIPSIFPRVVSRLILPFLSSLVVLSSHSICCPMNKLRMKYDRVLHFISQNHIMRYRRRIGRSCGRTQSTRTVKTNWTQMGQR